LLNKKFPESRVYIRRRDRGSSEAEAAPNWISMGHPFAPGQLDIASRTRIDLDRDGRRKGADLDNSERDAGMPGLPGVGGLPVTGVVAVAPVASTRTGTVHEL